MWNERTTAWLKCAPVLKTGTLVVGTCVDGKQQQWRKGYASVYAKFPWVRAKNVSDFLINKN